MNKLLKNIIIFSVIIMLFSISSVNADDGNTTGNYDINKIPQQISIEENTNLIHLSNGIYKINISKEFNKNTTIIGENVENTIIEYDGLNQTSVFTNSYVTLNISNITLKGVTIYNKGVLNANNVIFINCKGNSPLNIYNSIFGGAIINNLESKNVNYETGCNLNNCTFINNTSEYGGAIHSKNINIDINNTKFINNHASSYGAAISIDSCEILINNSCFTQDYSLEDAGGSIYGVNSKGINIINTNFNNCSGRFGGSICLLNSKSKIINSTFKNNHAKIEGGAIYQMYGELTINNSKFLNNIATDGGAVFTDYSNVNILTNNQFNNNQAINKGGAIFSNGINVQMNNNIFLTSNDEIYSQKEYNKFIENQNYTIYSINSTFKENIPLKYNLIDEGFSTPAKKQGNGGNCWAFSAIASLESCILKAGGIEYDFSESNMKNLAAYYSAYGWNIKTNAGGFDSMALGYLTSWLGPVSEYEDKYDDNNHLSPVLNSLIHVQNIYVIPERTSFTDNNAVKLAILNYGGIATNLCYKSIYYNNKTTSYYNPILSNINHAITIVGWDDNYSRNNFLKTPSGDGAFIVKNSWGDEWGANGYFYISYYDASLLRIGFKNEGYTFILNDTTKYNKNYQYDIGGVSNYHYVPSYDAWYANDFNSTGNDNLAAFSTYFNKKTNYTACIYVNNHLILEQIGTIDEGYHTIKLNQQIPLKKGDIFRVAIQIKSNLRNICFPISEYGKTQSPTRNISTSKISFYKYGNTDWIELLYPACIKAFTIKNSADTDLETSIKLNNSIEISKIKTKLIGNDIMIYYRNGGYVVKLTDLNQNPIAGAKITFTINGENYTRTTDNQGLAKIKLNLRSDTYILEAKFEGDYSYESSNITNKAIVLSTIKSCDVVKMFKNNTQYLVYITDNNGCESANINVELNINGIIYKRTSNEYGFVKLNINLMPGTYIVTVLNVLTNEVKSNNITVLPILSENYDLEKYFKNESQFTIKALDNQGNPVSNEKVIFNINGIFYEKTTNTEGIAKLNINLSPGNYIITSIYNEFMISNNIIVKSKIISNDLNMNYNDKSKFRVILLDNHGNPVHSNQQVIFNINGVIYTRFTNNEGVASLNINLQKGKYIITSFYNNLPQSNTITIK